MNELYIEIIGYIAMTLVGISFLMKEIKALRMLNLLGASTFILYGVILSQPPIYILNIFIVLVNLYYLIKLNKEKK
jgi:hypothetical protein